MITRSRLLLLACAVVWVAAWHGLPSYDDAYITFRYARHLAAGQGLVYNPGEPYLGTSAPGFALLLGLLAMPRPDLVPVLAAVISALAVLATGVALIALEPKAGLYAALVYVLSAPVELSLGGEILVETALVAWAAVWLIRDRPLRATLAVALAVLIRPDALLAAGLLGLALWVRHRRFPWRPLAFGLAVLAPFALAAWTYYGAILPPTMQAKRAQLPTGLWYSFFDGADHWYATAILAPAPMVIRLALVAAAVLAVIGVPLLLRRRSPLLLPVLWAAAFALAYHLLGLPFYPWYVVPLALGLSASFGVAVAACGRPGVALAAALLLPRVAYVPQLAHSTETPRQVAYRAAGAWLATHTPPNATVGYPEIGWLGYVSDRPILDPLGLVTPGLSPHVARRDFRYAYRHHPPDYLLHSPAFDYLVGPMSAERWGRAYVVDTAFTAGSFGPLTVYRRVGR